jgi:NTP pyrophosphatase (non-canonical NTP hydrolase)
MKDIIQPDCADSMDDVFKLNCVAQEVMAEVYGARSLWPEFNSAHEGFAVLLEEVDELKAHVWKNQKKRDLESMKKEAIQVAAMAIRFATEVCSEQKGRV